MDPLIGSLLPPLTVMWLRLVLRFRWKVSCRQALLTSGVGWLGWKGKQKYTCVFAASPCSFFNCKLYLSLLARYFWAFLIALESFGVILSSLWSLSNNLCIKRVNSWSTSSSLEHNWKILSVIPDINAESSPGAWKEWGGCKSVAQGVLHREM